MLNALCSSLVYKYNLHIDTQKKFGKLRIKIENYACKY